MRYVLKSSNKFSRSDDEIELEDFTEKEFQDFENGTLESDKQRELLGIAIEAQGLEFWIEKVKED